MKERSYFQKRSYLYIFLFCIFLSSLFHFFLFEKFKLLYFSSFNPSSFDKILPRRLQLKRIEIDPALLEEESQKKYPLTPVGITLLESETPFDQQLIATDVKPSEIKTEEILKEKTKSFSGNQLNSKQQTNFPLPSIEWEKMESENASSLKNVVPQQKTFLENYSQLEKLLEEKEPLTSKTAPILLPTDLLFEYNADKLKKDAEKSLEKLLILMQRNPKAQFIIEGFSDSFGSDEYNLDLSQRRADSIKKWLLSQQILNGSTIQARCFGKTHFIVPSNGSIEQQRLNRRVEIVIHQ